MILAGSYTLEQTPATLRSLLGIQSELRGGWNVHLRAAAGNSNNVLYGNHSVQPMILDAGERVTELCNINLDELYLVGDAASQVVNVFAQSC